jgi:integrase
MNLAQAQPIYFLGMRLALERTEARYRGVRVDSSALVDGIMRLNAEQRLAAMTVSAGPSNELANPGPAKVVSAATTAASPDPAASTSSEERRVTALGKTLELKRVKERSWDTKTARQASRLFALFERFLAEECAIDDLSALHQPQLAKFVKFLQFEVYKHCGKSGADENRSIAELRAIAASKADPKLLGVEAPTLNRHLTFLNQLFAHARAQGLALYRDLQTAGLRGRNNRDDRARNARPTLKEDAATRVFSQPPFTGCQSWAEPILPGPEIFHRALYFVPLLLYYSGARREEICGLSPDDVIVDNGPIPYIHIAPNKLRRVKNAQSTPNNPIHPELVRLGFLDYVKAIKALGYTRLFPDLYSPSSKSPLGDRFYTEFKPVLAAADTDEDGFVIHSVRGGFGNALKQNSVTEEARGDLLGHVGKTETSERYCNAFEIKKLNKFVIKVPIVTAKLTSQPIRLLPWVEKRELAPFSRALRVSAK